MTFTYTHFCALNSRGSTLSFGDLGLRLRVPRVRMFELSYAAKQLHINPIPLALIAQLVDSSGSQVMIII
jgi:hypothetical protein